MQMPFVGFFNAFEVKTILTIEKAPKNKNTTASTMKIAAKAIATSSGLLERQF